MTIDKYLVAGAIVPVDIETTATLIGEIQALRAKLEACERDAQRYRHLRDELLEYEIFGGVQKKAYASFAWHVDGRVDEKSLDRAIDAAIQSSKQESKS